jgi:glycosyltransferase EpsJ
MPHFADCLSSLCHQTLDSYEIILVDDRSDDGSSAFSQIYSEFSDKIKILYQYHAGVSAARNKGLQAARGEFVAFVDADDYVEPDFLEELYMSARSQGADLLTSGFFKDDKVSGQSQAISPFFEPGSFISKTDISAAAARMHQTQVFNYFWRNLYSNDLIKKNKIRFDEDMSVGEDTLFCMECMLKAKRVAASDLIGYHYRIHPGSTMRQEHIDTLFPSLQKQFRAKLQLAQIHLADYLDEYNDDLARHGLEVLLPLIIKNIYKGPEEERTEELKTVLESDFLSFCFDHYDLENSPVKSTDLILLRLVKKKRFQLTDLLCRRVIFKKEKGKEE